MGLIMLILIGTVPTAYAVNHAVTYQQTADFIAVSTQAANALDHYISPAAVVGDSRDELTDYIRTKNFTPNTMLALRGVIKGIGTEMAQYKLLKAVPQDKVRNFRNDMYVVSEALRLRRRRGSRGAEVGGRYGDPRELQKAHRQRDEVHSDVGESGGGPGAGAGNNNRMEADRGDGGRKNREESSDVRAGSDGRTGRMSRRSGRRIRVTGQYDSRAVIGRSGHDGGEYDRGLQWGTVRNLLRWRGYLRCRLRPHWLERCSLSSAILLQRNHRQQDRCVQTGAAMSSPSFI